MTYWPPTSLKGLLQPKQSSISDVKSDSSWYKEWSLFDLFEHFWEFFDCWAKVEFLVSYFPVGLVWKESGGEYLFRISFSRVDFFGSVIIDWLLSELCLFQRSWTAKVEFYVKELMQQMVITSQYHITQLLYNVAEFFRAISLMLWERTYLTCDSHTIIGKSRPLLLLRFSDNFFSIFVYIFRLNIKAISKIFI